MKRTSIFSRNRKSSQPGGQGDFSRYDEPAGQFGGDNDEIQGLSDLYFPEETAEPHVRDLADVLLEMQRLTPDLHARIRGEMSSKPGADLTGLLMGTGTLTGTDIQMAKAKLYDVPFKRFTSENVQKEAFDKLDIDSIQTIGIMPVEIDDNTLVVATTEPENVFAIESVKTQVNMPVRLLVTVSEDIDAVCEAFGATETLECDVDDIISDMTEVEVIQDQNREVAEDLEKMAGQSPVIKFVNYLISSAIREGASDIHIEPKPKHTRIRNRIDGVLFEVMTSPLKMHPAIVSRIKVMANLDISERRLPQDGKVSVIVGGREIDLRVSTLPTSMGEKVVIRVLDSRSILRGLEELGMEPELQAEFKRQVTLPHGIMLVTGPTGSGKSTTLYTALGQMDGDTLNISTVEDPVEYRLEFCNQVQAIEKIGLTFASALRSLLRQDPDVIMIGEIRDVDTASIAVQAALTGHLVLSTLHTNDAPSSVTRLVNIGVEAYLIAASLNGILAQRLVRRVCQNCKERYEVPEPMRKFVDDAGIKLEDVVHGVGCDQCRDSGYSGRVGIYELLTVDDAFRDMINTDASVSNMRNAFRDSGKPGLYDDGMAKVRKGLTTVEEVLRVTEANTRKAKPKQGDEAGATESEEKND